MSLTGNAKLAGIAGWPVGHSLSPRLHAYWIAEHKLDAAYLPLPVRREDFAPAVALLPKLGFRGLNITIPHKQAAFALATEHDEAAKATGAVNTLVFDNGRIIGKNTDVTGFIGMLRDAGVTTLAGKNVLVYGAGGAARAVIFALTKLNAAQICIWNRTPSKAQELAAHFDRSNSTRVEAATSGAHDVANLIVNTTSVGMTGANAPAELPGLGLAYSFSVPKGDLAVVDVVYRPLETPFLARYREMGVKTIDGLGMLLHQAVPAFAAWFGVEPKVTPALRAHLLAALEG